MVVLEQTTKSFTAFDFASNRISITVRLNQLIAESLMIPLTVVILDVFTNGLLERSPPKKIIRERHSDLRLQNHLSMYAFRLGLLDGSRTISVSVFCSRNSRMAMKLVSRSTMR